MYNVVMAKDKIKDNKKISWQAAEAILYKHNKQYYMILASVVVVLSGLCIWLQQWITMALIILMAVAIVVVNKKPFKLIQYEVSSEGISINGKIHDYSDFRSFGVRHDGGFWSLVLMPVKRFASETTIFIKKEQGEEIIDLVAKFLPMEKLRADIFGKITRFLQI